MIISFNNFKSFSPKENLHNLFFNRLNLIYGLNNSGKTSIIQLLKLFHYNSSNLQLLKTNFEKLNLGSFENILNSETKDEFTIYFSQGFINQGLSRRTNDKDTPIASIGFKYSRSANLKSIYFILNYTSSDGFHYITFDDLENNLDLTYFEFQFNDALNEYLLTNWRPATKCKIFNLDDFTEAVFDTRRAVSKKLTAAKKAYSLANAIFETLEASTELFLTIIKDPSSFNLIKIFEDVLDYESAEKIFNLNDLNTPEAMDILQEVFSKRRYGNDNKRNIDLLKEYLSKFSYSELNKNIKRINPDIYQNLKDKKIEELAVEYFQINNPKEWETFLPESHVNLILNDKSFALTLLDINKTLEVIEDYLNYDEQGEIENFYESIGSKRYQVDKNLYWLFSKFPVNAFDLLDEAINTDISLKQCKNIFRKIIKNTFINKMSFEFNSNSKRRYSITDNQFKGNENSILNIFNNLDLPEYLKKVNAFFDGFKPVDTSYTIRPLEKLISIDSSNCILNERSYLLKEYDEETPNIYDQSFITSQLFRNKKLLRKINENLKTLDLNFEISIKSTVLNSGNIILEPILCKSNSRGKMIMISTLYDAGQATKKLIPLLYYLNYTEDGILTIEEPEANIHPKYQANLANIFVDTLINNNNELVIETHSELLVLRFLKLIKEKKLENSLFSIHFTKKTNEKSEINKINVSDDGKLKNNWPDGFFKERLKELL